MPEAFANTPEFGRFITEVRSQVGRSRKAIEDGGGPSERHQQDIESGKEMPITARIRAQYCTYLDKVESGWRDFFDAACAAFSGAQHTPELGGDDSLWPLYPGSGFQVGDLTRPGSLINLGSLLSPEGGGSGGGAVNIRSFFHRLSGESAFIQAASRIATRFDAVTVMALSTAKANKFTSSGPWPGHLTYRLGVASEDGFSRLFMDPLRDVNDLDKAYLRAAALGAVDTDRTCLAWAVLLANGVAAQTGTNPLQSWINLFASNTAADERTRWQDLLQQLPADTGLITTVTVERMIGAAERYLLPWTEEWLAAKGVHFNVIKDNAGTALTWSLNTAGWRGSEWNPNDSEKMTGPQLWLCDRAMIKAAPAILTARGAGSFVLNDIELTATGAEQPHFIWCPIGAGDRHVVLLEVGTKRWRSALLY